MKLPADIAGAWATRLAYSYEDPFFSTPWMFGSLRLAGVVFVCYARFAKFLKSGPCCSWSM
jgi:hypothetical protein